MPRLLTFGLLFPRPWRHCVPGCGRLAAAIVDSEDGAGVFDVLCGDVRKSVIIAWSGASTSCWVCHWKPPIWHGLVYDRPFFSGRSDPKSHFENTKRRSEERRVGKECRYSVSLEH